jgi:hypothetical protein
MNIASRRNSRAYVSSEVVGAHNEKTICVDSDDRDFKRSIIAKELNRARVDI